MALALKQVLNCLVKEQVFCIIQRDMSKLDVATMSIGQGIAVTDLQMVRAFGALSNGGAMMKPHIIKSYSNSQGDVTECD